MDPAVRDHLLRKADSGKDIAVARQKTKSAQPGTKNEASSTTLQNQTTLFPVTKTLLGVGVAVWVIWMGILIALAAFSANPVSFNLEQLKHSDYVVAGKIADRDAGQIKIESPERHGLTEEILTIVDFLQLKKIEADKSYLFPLRKADQNFRIAPLPPLARGEPIYPATAESREKLAEVLRDLGKRSAH